MSDNIERADWHAWNSKHWDVQRMLRYLPADETALYRARQLLMSKSYGVDSAIAKVPAKYKNDKLSNVKKIKLGNSNITELFSNKHFIYKLLYKNMQKRIKC